LNGFFNEQIITDNHVSGPYTHEWINQSLIEWASEVYHMDDFRLYQTCQSGSSCCC